VLQSGVDTNILPEKRGADEKAEVDFCTAFWLATVGGGKALGLPVGLFQVGYFFDAILVEANILQSNLFLYEGDTHQDILQKIVNNTTPLNIRHVWVNGKSVHSCNK